MSLAAAVIANDCVASGKLTTGLIEGERLWVGASVTGDGGG